MKPNAGNRVKIIEEKNGGGEEVGQGIALESKENEVILHHPENPKQIFKFAMTPKGWQLIFRDPFTNRICYSQRAPSYKFELIE